MTPDKDTQWTECTVFKSTTPLQCDWQDGLNRCHKEGDCDYSLSVAIQLNDRIAQLQTRVTELLAEREKLRKMLERLFDWHNLASKEYMAKYSINEKELYADSTKDDARALLETTQDGGDGDENL